MKLSKTLIALIAVFFILGTVRLFSQPLLNENSVKFENVQTATLVGQDGLIMRTVDGGLSWIPQISGITNVLYSNEFVSYTDDINGETVNLQLAVGENGIILRSINNGLSWTLISSFTAENLNDIAVFTPNLIYVSGNNGTLLRSVDYGKSWSPVLLPISNSLNHIAVFGPSTLETTLSAIAVGDSGTCYGSVNMQDWFPITVPTTENLLSVEFNGNNVICAGTNGIILKSINNGYDWIVSASGITTMIYDMKFVTSTTVVATSENGVLVRSEDAGDNWTIITTPTTADLFAVNFGSNSFGMSTGSEGSKIYTLDGGITWVTSLITASDVNSNSENVKLNQNYPNPFNPSTIISYSVNDASNVNIRIFDMTGREIRTLVNSFQNAGTYSVNFNANNLASGIYFYVLRVNNGSNEITKTMRMILTK